MTTLSSEVSLLSTSIVSTSRSDNPGGSAGSCLASRLSEIPGASVLVIERGQILDTWSNRVPLISANFFRQDSPSVLFPSEPLAHANHRIVQIVSGEGIGGTSRINGCLYSRGLKGDWNRWNRPGWSYDDMVPYFQKSEKSISQPGSYFRGKSGKLEHGLCLDGISKFSNRSLDQSSDARDAV